MIKRITVAASLAALSAFAAPASAQQRGLRPVSNGSLFQITPYVGYMIFGDFLEGPLGTTVSTKNNAVYGAQVGMYLAPNISLIGNIAYSNTDLRIGVPFLGGLSVGSSNVWLYDGGLQFDIPVDRNGVSPVRPFVQVGAGAMHYDISAANILDTKTTNFAFNAGAGLDYHVSPTIGIQVMAKDYIGKFDFKQATSVDLHGRTAQNWALTAGVRFGF